MSSAGSRGTSRRRRCSSASDRRATSVSASAAKAAILGAELAGGGDVVVVLLQLLPDPDDPAELGVALVEPLGEAGVRVGLGRGQPPLELLMLGEHPFHGLEHAYLNFFDGAGYDRRRPRTDAGAGGCA